jgi:hypothetical protein
MDTSYQDMPYQDMPYQDMPYTTWKIRDTGEQKQVQTKIFIRKKSLLTSSFTFNPKWRSQYTLSGSEGLYIRQN